MSIQQTASPRKHAYTEASAAQEPEPTHAERVRTLLSLAKVATLSTQSKARPGYPFGSLMPYALDRTGRPIFLISSMAMHTQNLVLDPRASLFVGQAGEGDALGTARATLVGDVLPVPADDLAETRELYLASYENSRSWVDFQDFRFYRLQPVAIYYVGGFGVMGWVAAEDYLDAGVDPLAESAPHILEHMNHDHVAAMILLAKEHAGLKAVQASMVAIDRLGFNLRLQTADGAKGARISFPREVRSADDTRQVLVEMVRTANAGAQRSS